MGIQWIKESYIGVLAGIRYILQSKWKKKHKKGGGGAISGEARTPTPVLFSLTPPCANP